MTMQTVPVSVAFVVAPVAATAAQHIGDDIDKPLNPIDMRAPVRHTIY